MHNVPVSPHRWRWSSRDETAPVWPGHHQQLGATWGTARRPTSPSGPPRPPACGSASSTRTAPRPGTSSPSTPSASGTARSPGSRSARSTASVPTGRGTRATGAGSTATSCCSTRTRGPSPASRCPATELLALRPQAAPTSPARPTRRRRCRAASSSHDDFDWDGDTQLRTRWRDTVIYELHVKGFTKLHNEIPEHLRGTYAGLGSHTVTRYLQDLGVTAVELLPVHHFFTEPAVAARGMTNYWGYNSIGFFAPHSAYSASGDARPAGHRVQADGPELPRGRHRGDPRRGLQPHRRGRPRRADVLLPRAGRLRLLQARRHRRRRLLGRHRLRQHRRLHQPRRRCG